MSKPQDEPNNERYLKESYLFFSTVAKHCEDTEECRRLLKDLLTASELRMLKKRWYIARLLHEGMDVRSVASEAQVSTTTVVRVSQTLKRNGMFKEMLEKLTEEETPKPATGRYSFGKEE